MNAHCPCTGFCRLKMERRADGPFPECAPLAHCFHVVRDRYVKSADGDCEWDGIFLPGRHATLEAALMVVSEGHPISRFVVEEAPRFGMFPRWSGHPEDARAVLELELVKLAG